MIAAGFYKFIEALEYETVNMEAQTEKTPCPQQGSTIEAKENSKPAILDKAISESSDQTRVGDTHPRKASTDLEAQQSPRA